MQPVVHKDAAAASRLRDLALTPADLISALIGADQEARTWTRLAPPMISGLALGKTNELLRARLVERGWGHGNPRGLPRTISPTRDLAAPLPRHPRSDPRRTVARQRHRRPRPRQRVDRTNHPARPSNGGVLVSSAAICA